MTSRFCIISLLAMAILVPAVVPNELPGDDGGIDRRCGPDAPGGAKRCTGIYTESCCSSYGYCGTTDAYCGNGCQYDWGNGCGDNGGITRRCGADAPGGAKSCSGVHTEECCSSYGYCGLTDAYCDPSKGCQPQWGWGCFE